MLTEQQHVSVEKPGVLKRLVGRARSKSDLSRKESVSSIASNASDLSRSTTGGSVASTTERSRGRVPSFKTPSFKAGSSSNSSASPPAHKKLSVPSARPHPEAGLSRDLWDEAYDALRLDPSTASLVVTYESIISQELPEDVKLDLMTAIATAGLSKRRGSKSSEVDDSTPRTLEHTKRIVESQLDDFPSTALAWAGLCTLTPTIDKMVDGIFESDETARELLNELVVEGPRREKMATRDVDLDVDALDKLRQQEVDDLKIPEDRPL
ncbi:Glycolipid 2-alpha-mannosyltransferase-like protein [Emericellopsis cladophorae]|uniref:Glycolipid 2-alpha-mannosyltransferase-like protein n=1 Tax=Emericellopsis cladophorae TaxID=2686198 RepID=A0A9Q0BB48_9HYPO|nr:Glycolipid 2-alpha-mannosyltransferase-like protein [Emericellopsis cladophorae]KAI6777679.1 Glycolipid 2-alpha-mannosyltransferase-like protein [Emericellopsis cladophorae]